MDATAYRGWLANLLLKGTISKYDEHLMSFIGTEDAIDWAYA